MLDASQLRRLGQATAAGAELATTVVLGTLAGQWLDGRFGTAPVLLLLFSLGALVLALVRLSRNLASDDDDSEDLAPQADDPHPPPHPPALGGRPGPRHAGSADDEGD